VLYTQQIPLLHEKNVSSRSYKRDAQNRTSASFAVLRGVVQTLLGGVGMFALPTRKGGWADGLNLRTGKHALQNDTAVESMYSKRVDADGLVDSSYYVA
jgi:hypothetical protein